MPGLRPSAAEMSWAASLGRCPSCLVRISNTAWRSPSSSMPRGGGVPTSAGRSGRERANLATFEESWATMFLAFCGPMPGSLRRYVSSCRAMGPEVFWPLRAGAGAAPEGRLGLAGDGGGDLRDRGGQRARRHEGAHVLHGDQLLEELLVEPGVESDEDGRRLVLRRVVVDL